MDFFKIGTLDSKNLFLLVENIEVEPLTPKRSTLSLKERDGEIDFSFLNQYERYIYDNRVITISAIYRYNDFLSMPDKLSKIYEEVYKNVRGELELSTVPGVKWNAVLLNMQKQEITGISTARIVIQYSVSPFSYGEAVQIYSGDIIGNKSITISNPGKAPTNSHKITISNIRDNTTGFILQRENGQLIECSKILSNDDVLIIDFLNFEITVNGEKLQGLEWGGDFFEISKDSEIFEIAFTGSASMVWEAVPMYFYSAI